MSTRFKNMFVRKGTRGRYDGDSGKKQLPAASETEPVIIPPKGKDKEDKDDKTDQTVAQNENQEDRDANTDVQTAQVKSTVEHGILKTKEGTRSNSTAAGVYSRLWKNVTDYKMAPIRYSSTAWWIPNAIPFRPVAEACSQLVGQSNHAMKHEVDFLPYAFETGMYYLYFIQILRAQKAAGELSGQELSALARFEKYNPLESIIIPEPFIPLLESIVAVELEDSKYHWLVPNHGLDFSATPSLATLCTPNVVDLVRPNVAFMLANLSTFGSMTVTELGERIDESLIFTPIELRPTPAANVRFIGGNRDFAAAHPGAHTADVREVLTACGASVPFQFWNDNYNTAHRNFKRSRFFVRNGVDVALTSGRTNPDTNANLTDTKTFNNLDAYLFVAKGNNPSWFQYLAEQINTVARFFPGSKPMSKIATTGGMEPSVICHLKTEENQATAPQESYVYPNLFLGNTGYGDLRFYDDKFKNLTASFTTTRADLERNEELTAFALATCAIPPVAVTNNGIGHLRGGKFYEDVQQGNGPMQAMELGFVETHIRGSIPMYAGWREEYVKSGFKKSPSNV